MKFLQFLPQTPLDAFRRSEITALQSVLRDMGCETGMYAKEGDGDVLPFAKLPKLSATDVILYHKTPGTNLAADLSKFPCRKILRFHGNIPPRLWKGYDTTLAAAAERSLDELCRLANVAELTISELNAQNDYLQTLHYQGQLTTCPPLFSMSGYATQPDAPFLRELQAGGYQNFLYAGQIAPYARLEDLLKIFYCYQRYCHSKSRLVFLQTEPADPKYNPRLLRYAAALGLKDHLLFPESQTTAQTLAYFHAADFYLDMSLHCGFTEGQIVSMYLGTPALWRDTPEHRGVFEGAGLCLESNEKTDFPMEGAMLLQYVRSRLPVRRSLAATERRRLQALSLVQTRRHMREILDTFLQTSQTKG